MFDAFTSPLDPTKGSEPSRKEPVGNLDDLQIIDCAPTILHFFGLPVSKAGDGQARKEIFSSSSEAANREVRFIRTDEEDEKKEYIWDEKQKSEVRDRLRSMGYL